MLFCERRVESVALRLTLPFDSLLLRNSLFRLLNWSPLGRLFAPAPNWRRPNKSERRASAAPPSHLLPSAQAFGRPRRRRVSMRPLRAAEPRKPAVIYSARVCLLRCGADSAETRTAAFACKSHLSAAHNCSRVRLPFERRSPTAVPMQLGAKLQFARPARDEDIRRPARRLQLQRRSRYGGAAIPEAQHFVGY